MELGGWTSDLDSSLLNCWNENAETNSRGSFDPKDKRKYDNESSSSARSSPRDDTNGWDGNLNQWSQLPSFGVDYEAAPSEKSKASEEENKTSQDSRLSMPEGATPQIGMVPGTIPTRQDSTASAIVAISVSETTSVTASSVTELSDTSSRAQQPSRRPSTNPTGGNNNSKNSPYLHPLAIQSSATCPPHSSALNKTDPPQFGQMPVTPSSTIPQQQQPHQQPQNLYALNFSHALDNSSAVSLAASLQRTNSHATSSTASAASTTNHHLSSLTANFMLAQAGSETHEAAAPAPRSHRHSAPTVRSPSPSANSVTATSTSAMSGSSSCSSSLPSHHKPQQQQRSGEPPPFYLFDAPIELRANFELNQRKLGIPVQHDCNSYHYGEMVKGFHPQHLLNEPPQQAVGQPARGPVQLIDARHGTNSQQGTGRVKNEREQKRAQKITELIEQLRVNMENGGWKVEMRSKFHTLSSCAEYVKHMIEVMKEKEEAVKKLRSDLEVKQLKIEEDKALQESRSDPESVVSNLTSSTTGSGQACHQNSGNDKKRKADSEVSSGNKKHRSRNMSSASTNEDSSGGEDRGSRGPSARSFSTDKTVSSVSDITDSNRGSSSNNSGSGSGSEVPTERVSRVSADEADEEQPSSSCISSDAAVLRENSSRDRHSSGHRKHKDVVFNKEKKRSDRKRKPEEVTSLERSFELDYEEVFDNSNIPQLIAATSGKIVTWNECFIKATGLRKSEVERMTIFSLVKPDKLSNFFEIVAAALRPDDEDDEPPETDDYAAMTLPCIDFPAAMKNRRKSGERSHHNDPLHVTVTLMADKDPRKRCFHCVFTNCPGTKGALGSITPELLSSLFTTPEANSKKGKTHHNKNKRARVQKDLPPKEEEETKEVEQEKQIQH
jgi:PAS domain-containing protein